MISDFSKSYAETEAKLKINLHTQNNNYEYIANTHQRNFPLQVLFHLVHEKYGVFTCFTITVRKSRAAFASVMSNTVCAVSSVRTGL